jgi:hypothetical protein
VTDVRSIVPVDPVEWTFGFVTLTLDSESDGTDGRWSSGPIAVMLSNVYPLFLGIRPSGTRRQTIEAARRDDQAHGHAADATVPHPHLGRERR